MLQYFKYKQVERGWTIRMLVSESFKSEMMKM